VEDVRKGLIGKIGENMSIRRFKRYAGGGQLAHYLHGTRIGVVVEFDGDDVAAKDVAMHVAAMKPKALATSRRAGRADRSRAPRRRREGGRGLAAAVAAGKPRSRPRSWPSGRRLGAEVPEGGLAAQPALRQERQADRRADAQGKGTQVAGFTLYVVGEGIEKKVDDFAAEVAAQVAAAKGQ
jgi:elongation factor Ts